ncbi:hypothetical protein AeMF1_015598 [Aphanomyces euteiches]|nr:hypothetical protein AeMF1_015598 [Aphanomyces euteiches]
MPVGACIDPVTKQCVAEWDMGKDPDDVTEGEWIEWFKLAYDVDPRALDGLKKRIAAAVVFDMSITDADSRIGRMLDGMSAAIRRDRQEWVLREESPAIVKIITAAIKPASLQRAVTEQMDLSRNKPLKKDVYRFVRWLREYAIGHERFVGYEEEKPVAKQAPTSSQPQKVAFAPGASARASPMGCLKCKSPDHRVRDCPDVTKDEAVALLKGHANALAVERTRGASKGSAAVKRVAKVESVPREDLACTVEGTLPVRASLLDSGADISVASGGLVSALIAAGAAVDLTSTVPVSLQPYGAESSPICVTKQVRLWSLEFKTAFGPLLLRGLRVWVDETVSDVELTLGLPVMKKLGYNDQTLLENARRQQAVWDFGDQPTSTPGVAMHRALRVEERTDDIDDDEGMCCATPELRAPDGADDKAIVREILLSKVDDACAEGMAPEDAERLTSVLLEFQDVFRVRFGQDPPVKVAPLEVHLKAGAVPVKSGLRRYPPTHLEFLEKHVRELEDAGLVYRNTRSRWAAAPRIANQCVHGVNAVADAQSRGRDGRPQGLEGLFHARLDEGVLAIPLHPESQEYYSFMAPIGVVTPTRVLMGQSDAVAYCQGVVDELFGEMIMHGLLGWLDDLLGYARTASDLMDLLKRVLAICQAYGLKLHPKKCAFYTTKTIWCGKEVSAEGVAHAPARVQGLCELEPPQTAAELQQFLCATNWMRANIPEYSALVAPLTKLLDIGAKAAASRKKTALARVSLSSIGWCEDHAECFESVKTTLQRMVPLAHPDPDKMVCLYTDASDGFWGAIATQVPLDDLELVASEQRHEPLAFLSGAFRGASERWPIAEIEAFAVVESCKRLEYLLIRPGGFRLFTDHRNLVYMFNPLGASPNMAKYQAHKLQRWSLTMTTFPYVIECVAGEDNL